MSWQELALRVGGPQVRFSGHLVHRDVAGVFVEQSAHVREPLFPAGHHERQPVVLRSRRHAGLPLPVRRRSRGDGRTRRAEDAARSPAAELLEREPGVDADLPGTGPPGSARRDYGLGDRRPGLGARDRGRQRAAGLQRRRRRRLLPPPAARNLRRDLLRLGLRAADRQQRRRQRRPRHPPGRADGRPQHPGHNAVDQRSLIRASLVRRHNLYETPCSLIAFRSATLYRVPLIGMLTVPMNWRLQCLIRQSFTRTNHQNQSRLPPKSLARLPHLGSLIDTGSSSQGR